MTMDANKKALVLGIAQKVRERFEKIRMAPRDLQGYCCKASVELHRALRAHGIECSLCEAYNQYMGYHVYLELEGRRLDITCTQFGDFPKVFFGYPDGEWFWTKPLVRSKETAPFVDHVNRLWSRSQRPYTQSYSKRFLKGIVS